MIPFIFLTVYPRKVVQDRPIGTMGLQSWFINRPFPLFRQALYAFEWEVPVTNKPRRACLYVLQIKGFNR